jgi:hypothetical protein
MAHISTEEMFGLADGDLPSEERQRIIKHISSCERCREQMRSALSFNEELKRFWDEYLSKKCPDEEMLFGYIERSLEGDQLGEIDEHLLFCPVCRHKVESARESLEEVELLERATNVMVPSLINRLKRQLKKLEIENLLETIEKVLVPGKLGEEFFASLSKGIRVFTYPFITPLDAPALLPVSAGGVKLAETGKGFQRKILVGEGLPFEVEMVQFGDHFLLNIKALEEAHGDALAKYTLQEEGDVRHQGVCLFSEGKATIRLTEQEIEAIRPERRPLSLKLELLPKGEVLTKIKAEDFVGVIERLRENLVSEDPEMVEAAFNALQSIESVIPKEN